jgi:glycosyltransferase involved in cell wall biosynthesis
MGPDAEEPHYAAACRNRAHQLGLDGYVKFLGSVSLREVFGEYDMLVLGSYNEGQPVVVYEAMTVGLPVIGTAVGGMQALVATPMTTIDSSGHEVEVGPAGLLVEPGNVMALADILERAMTDEALYESMSRNGQERVDRFFQVTQVMENYSALYSELGAPPRPAAGPTIPNSPSQSSHDEASTENVSIPAAD